MLGRFSIRTVEAPEPLPEVESPLLQEAPQASVTIAPPAPEPAPAVTSKNALLAEKLLDAKVRLHRKLLEDINLSALEKLPEETLRSHVQELVTQYVLAERLALNTEELGDFFSEILDEMPGLGPLEPLLKDPAVNDILINGHEN